MNLAQRPMPGYWYSSSEGQLYQCRAFLYYKAKLARIWLEDITGVRASYTPAEWRTLDLILHSPVAVGNR